MTTSPTQPLPGEFQFGFVIGRSIHAIADTPADPDRHPEARGSTGTVTFTPHVRFARVLTEPTAFIQFENIQAKLDDGVIVDAEGHEGIYLISGAYTVTFQLDNGSIPSFSILVTPEHTQSNPLDLVTASPYEPPPGVTVVTMELPAGAAEGKVLAWQGDRLAWIDVGSGGDGEPGVTIHGRLSGLNEDDHPQYALADGSRGDFAPTSHHHDGRYVRPADLPATPTWSTLAGKPSTFPPSSHGHTIEDVTGLSDELEGKQDAGDYAPASHTHTWGQIQSKPTSFPPTQHGHDASEIDGLAEVALTGSYSNLLDTPEIPAPEPLPPWMPVVLHGDVPRNYPGSETLVPYETTVFWVSPTRPAALRAGDIWAEEEIPSGPENPIFIGSSYNRHTTNLDTITAPLPEGISEGDTILVATMVLSSSATVSQTGGSTVTSLGRAARAGISFDLWHRRATGSESGSLTFQSSAALPQHIAIYVLRGVDSVGTPASTNQGSGSTTIIAPDHSPASDVAPLHILGLARSEPAEAILTPPPDGQIIDHQRPLATGPRTGIVLGGNLDLGGSLGNAWTNSSDHFAVVWLVPLVVS